MGTYLPERDDEDSSHWEKYRVPQGSVLEPLLFSMHVDDIRIALEYYNFHMYDHLLIYLHFRQSRASKRRNVFC